MPVKPIIDEIEKEVVDVTNTNFVHNDTSVVPSLKDSDLTYESGVDKKGKKIETCVLFVDIRNSVALTEKHHTQTMGRIYTAFTKAVLKLARHHKGHTRNIIGDRVMVVFPVKDCFTNAVNCATSINHVAEKIINKKFNVDFKCGIGIDFGELRVIKVGIQRNGSENGENKGLVWVGYPANLASRLTDVANKSFEEDYFKVTRHPINPRAIKPMFPMPSIFGTTSNYDPNAPFYLSTTETVELTVEEFANSIAQYDDGRLFTGGGKNIKFEKKTRKYSYPPILLSEVVYKGYKKAKPNANDIKGDWWQEQKHDIPNVKGKVYGEDLTWSI
ncbi:adenylate/guanylate cyclase domain-containing protein [Flammeovirga aprica]|uniref:Adenylate/guanylate cyclase domain-containing protein n=1 Tax=Flammeovirga aprica JL-4 TaxID=694437 RepID=A0A7X9NYY2_9BACT|nr:adenylate/guanylate cyclase domain-containing protein [Flammeovirga aprica]NME66501.1 adenylate/guanylate cyclase domain-containing protein [Flammeovirga aprica JL-4]